MSDESDLVVEEAPVRARGWWFAFAVTTGVFVLGMLIGAVLTLGILRNSSPWRFDAPAFRPERITERLTAQLNLTPEQSDAIREIFREQHAQLSAIRRETEPRVREVLDETHARVLAELTDEQRVVWEERYERMRRRMRAPGWDRKGDGRRHEARDPEELIRKFDRDGDGTLDFDELSVGWKRLTPERFQRMDHNDDGQLDRDELQGANRDAGPDDRRGDEDE